MPDSAKIFFRQWRFRKPGNFTVIRKCAFCLAVAGLISGGSQAQSIRFPWSGYAHDPQHDAIAPVASQPLNRIVWQTSVDLSVPTNNTSELFIHYGSPLITRSNTVIVPVKTRSGNALTTTLTSCPTRNAGLSSSGTSASIHIVSVSETI